MKKKAFRIFFVWLFQEWRRQIPVSSTFFTVFFQILQILTFLQPRDRSHRGRDIIYPLNIIDNIHIDFVRSCQYLQRCNISFIPIGRISCRYVDIHVFKQQGSTFDMEMFQAHQVHQYYIYVHINDTQREYMK